MLVDMAQVLNWYDCSEVKFPTVAGERIVELGPHTSLTYLVPPTCDPEIPNTFVLSVFTPLHGTFVGFIPLVEAALEVLREGRAFASNYKEAGGIWWNFIFQQHGTVPNPADLVSMALVALEVHHEGLIRLAKTHRKFSPALQFR
ncbi:uncharacterized protein KD926_006376 [Aspergillus affinis]|uniref:uncharacterized protein n=1 Tax=Aspergillus affinis TaxID=1070780 RepID=UPI0022FE1334|nr:uncharacterized protein KD926_006376 [Aspergillus affinis]KAI9041831.1 hypothetical protein KD926_006376 [Aspergillus affinis]